MRSSDVVLLAGAGRPLGARIATRLSRDPGLGRILAVDTVPPRGYSSGLGRADFTRADVRHPLIAKVLDQAEVDVVVHPGVLLPNTGPHRHGQRDEQLDGVANLLAACERSSTVRRVVLGSTTAVYGASSRDPAVRVETDAACGRLSGAARVAEEIEALARAFARSRPDVSVSVLRCAAVVGAQVGSWLTQYLSAPVVATVLGYDARLQVAHEDDVAEVFGLAAAADHPGVVNVAGDGVVMLSQVLRWARRFRVPVPAPAMGLLLDLGLPSGPGAEDAAYLGFGRAVDTSRLRAEYGYAPRFGTAEALRAALAAQPGPAGLVTRLPSFALAGARRVLVGTR